MPETIECSDIQLGALRLTRVTQAAGVLQA
jgi:hypothetical protein